MARALPADFFVAPKTKGQGRNFCGMEAKGKERIEAAAAAAAGVLRQPRTNKALVEVGVMEKNPHDLCWAQNIWGKREAAAALGDGWGK